MPSLDLCVQTMTLSSRSRQSAQLVLFNHTASQNVYKRQPPFSNLSLSSHNHHLVSVASFGFPVSFKLYGFYTDVEDVDKALDGVSVCYSQRLRSQWLALACCRVAVPSDLICRTGPPPLKVVRGKLDMNPYLQGWNTRLWKTVLQYV